MAARVRTFPSVAVMLLAAASLIGCGGSGNARASGDTVRENPAQAVVGDASAGRLVFAINCATCHGATGIEGGVGPSLRDERARKNYDATIAWIKHPLPPMPSLYPSPLSEEAVDDVAAYVQKL